MVDEANAQVIIRHTSGAKVNKIDQFQLAATKEITFGRDASSAVPFDGPRDDVVSRRHAVIRVKGTDPLTFAIEDLNSSNGTFLNGERLKGEREILPDDAIELGSGGPKFIFDVQPRPANLAARTRVLSTIETTATRVATAVAAAEPVTQKIAAPEKVGVGRNTVQFMLSEERKRSRQSWMGGIAAVFAFIVVGGGALYWNMTRTTQRLQDDVQEQARTVAQQNKDIQTNVVAQMGLSPIEVAKKYGNSTVMIDVRWRLYDKETGRPVFHKTIEHNKKRLPAYFQLQNGKIIRWLTTEDDEHKNIEIGQAGSGSGFVISENGFILTNKHIAAAWNHRFTPADNNTINGWLITPGSRNKVNFTEIDVSRKGGAEDLWNWVPEQDGGLLFGSQIPDIKNKNPSDLKVFYGRNEVLEVRFPNSKLSINAGLVRGSNEEDAALIKVDSPQQLIPLELASDDEIKVGEKVIVLGYPGISQTTVATFTTSEGGRVRSRAEIIPEPTVTDGIVSKLGTPMTQQGTLQVFGTRGDMFQLSVLATGPGNSGGPVFNGTGKVIGLFTGATSRDGTRVTHAVRIRHGKDLLNPQQRTQ